MDLPEATKAILWYVWCGLTAWEFLTISLSRADATLTAVLRAWSRDTDGLVAALLLGLWAHTFWR
jgi:hypothetical protein